MLASVGAEVVGVQSIVMTFEATEQLGLIHVTDFCIHFWSELFSQVWSGRGSAGEDNMLKWINLH